MPQWRASSHCQNRAGASPRLRHAGACAARSVRLHRRTLQFPPPALSARLFSPGEMERRAACFGENHPASVGRSSELTSCLDHSTKPTTVLSFWSERLKDICAFPLDAEGLGIGRWRISATFSERRRRPPGGPALVEY